ncbi:glutathione S-transferase N-terminal domain-containing protein [Bradyrhizobium sp. Ash2021]|uniref:glutathione S-transferase N-terminal domain-containing protein n=1 Tax=Bradyrhizobium sp. Ash2021 TaxID=2954771 RepID=UPI002815F269|nr:glutathione S-transferase N-terminal domain-containing protein [Bradyrhizobium sp. Ash2021]WMT74630.1 glutathione S-transferase N-terminal domain-containing protein [Bradyrhizobium sp. Ash2021]
MIRFYFHHAPNLMKVALLLEETAIPYEVIPVDTLKGEQHAPEFRAINPNGKTPAMLGDGRLGEFPNVARWFAGVDSRPAVTRARAIGKNLIFKRDMDDEARRNLFPQNYVAA